MKKALIVANLGGFVEFLYSDIKILQEMGYDVTYASNTEAANWDNYRVKLETMNVRIENICFDTKKPLSKENYFAYKQIKELLKEKFDLIHCHTPIVGILVKMAARKYRKSGTKVIYTTHGFTFNKKSSKKSWLIYYNLERYFSKLCDGIITINKEDYENAKKMKCKNVYYINGVGVDIKKYADVNVDIKEYREKIGVSEEKIMVLSIGELSIRKNHTIILDALSKLENKDKYVYVICGKEIYSGTEKMLKDKADKLNINLRLLGFRTDIPEIIHCSDIGALPSIREGLGLAGIQSLAGGVPIVASDVQGIKDYILDGKNGFLCNSDNSDEFAEAIKKLTDKKLRENMKLECKRMANNFDISISEKQRKKIYEEILE